MFWGGNKSDLECCLGRTEESCEIDLEFVLFGVLFKQSLHLFLFSLFEATIFPFRKRILNVSLKVSKTKELYKEF